MHSDEAPDRHEGGVTVVGPSLALDLSWALHTASKEGARPDNQAPVVALYGDRPDLVEAVRGFWGDDLRCFSELEVLASHDDALGTTDLDVLVGQLAKAIEAVPGDMALESETEHDRAIILERLAELRRSSERRRGWLALLAEVWGGLDAPWRRHGVPRVERTVAEARARLERATPWTSLVGSECEFFQAHLPDIVERHRAGRPVVVVPCAFFGKGLYMETPWSLVVGIRADGADAVSRARTADVARRLRAVADPTRLAILDFLADGPHTVGDIARSFCLAQPTVSSHVKHLREAGLVSAERQGARIEVSLDRDAVGSLAGEFGTLLSR